MVFFRAWLVIMVANNMLAVHCLRPLIRHFRTDGGLPTTQGLCSMSFGRTNGVATGVAQKSCLVRGDTTLLRLPSDVLGGSGVLSPPNAVKGEQTFD